MGSGPKQLHIFFFPHLAHGHMIPTIDMARLFARQHGVKAIIICTPLNAPLFSKVIERDSQHGIEISIRIVKFPSIEAGLPEGCENLGSTTSPEMFNNFYKALGMLQQPLEQLLEECRPNCLVADVMFPWATEVASKFGIPRLIFHGTSYFAFCVFHSLRCYEPLNTLSEFESFIVPGIPDQIKMTKSQQPSYFRGVDNELTKLTNLSVQSEQTSYGVLVNSFNELEPAYSEHYRKFIVKKAWSIGPVSLCNRDIEDKALRGNIASIDAYECLRWLELKNPNSVLYICFGSKFVFPDSQLLEIAKGLEAAGKHFIWVMKEEENINNQEKQEWLLEGFEKRVEGKGLIKKGWAPQALILDHKAIGGFMTHCRWNSVLESVTNGVPMITWPLYAEQFYNEKLVTDVLKIGVSVGTQECSRSIDARKFILKKEDIERHVNRLMVGEEAEEMRSKAKALKEMARKAVEEGGSSNSDLNALLQELRSL
ncbi:hypothetical protein EZV62_011239 [Acer yangbiense]|uniref:Glycosyltransferase n=1 Tax=Acer yangbiense TaxID=1000413 RepID=A0A5C7I553_9ROSI|nr:hypothetical protein EZV62_011239 [Acer yangbiense]